MDVQLSAPLSIRKPVLPLRRLGDERLAQMVGEGLDEAFAVLYQRHYQALYRYCGRWWAATPTVRTHSSPP
jgi:hypothetical protein